MFFAEFKRFSLDLSALLKIRVIQSVPPERSDSAIAEFIAKSSKLSNYRKNSHIFVIVADFLQILGLDASCDVIAMRIQSKKGCFSVPKILWTALRSLHARFTRATLDERIHVTRFGYTAQTVYLLGPELRAALDHATPLYTAQVDTVKQVVKFTAESITSLSNLVRSIQILHRILLKLLTSEQTALLWKPKRHTWPKPCGWNEELSFCWRGSVGVERWLSRPGP